MNTGPYQPPQQPPPWQQQPQNGNTYYNAQTKAQPFYPGQFQQPPYPPYPMSPQQSRHMGWRSFFSGIRVARLVLILLLAGVLILIATRGPQGAVLVVEPSCVVGVTGTAASVEIKSWTAQQDCQDMINRASSGNLYLMTEQPQQPIVCEVDAQGRHYIVRDEGVFKLVGNGICQKLEQLQG